MAAANRGFILVNMLTLAALAHHWIDKERQAELDADQVEAHSKTLIARNEQLESELLKMKTVIKGNAKAACPHDKTIPGLRRSAF